jgi:hypothetical protein
VTTGFLPSTRPPHRHPRPQSHFCRPTGSDSDRRAPLRPPRASCARPQTLPDTRSIPTSDRNVRHWTIVNARTARVCCAHCRATSRRPTHPIPSPNSPSKAPLRPGATAPTPHRNPSRPANVRHWTIVEAPQIQTARAPATHRTRATAHANPPAGITAAPKRHTHACTRSAQFSTPSARCRRLNPKSPSLDDSQCAHAAPALRALATPERQTAPEHPPAPERPSLNER